MILLCTLLTTSNGCGFFRGVGSFAGKLKDKVGSKSPLRDAQRMEDADFADERRIGINNLATKRRFARQPPYTDRYKQIAQTDSDWLVRATAVRALNISRDNSAMPLFMRSLTDANPRVRLEGVKALHNLPNPEAVPVLIRMMNSPEEDRDVRIASAQALKRYKTLEVGRQLAAQLQSTDFGIAWQARRSLREMTDRDFRYEGNLWLEYLNSPAKPFG